MVSLKKSCLLNNQKVLKVYDGGDRVYQLHKALYGLKQAPRAWYSKIGSHLRQCGFARSENKATLYVKAKKDGKLLIISIYVDDTLVTGNDNMMIKEFKEEMERRFEMSSGNGDQFM